MSSRNLSRSKSRSRSRSRSRERSNGVKYTESGRVDERTTAEARERDSEIAESRPRGYHGEFLPGPSGYEEEGRYSSSRHYGSNRNYSPSRRYERRYERRYDDEMGGQMPYSRSTGPKRTESGRIDRRTTVEARERDSLIGRGLWHRGEQGNVGQEFRQAQGSRWGSMGSMGSNGRNWGSREGSGRRVSSSGVKYTESGEVDERTTREARERDRRIAESECHGYHGHFLPKSQCNKGSYESESGSESESD